MDCQKKTKTQQKKDQAQNSRAEKNQHEVASTAKPPKGKGVITGNVVPKRGGEILEKVPDRRGREPSRRVRPLMENVKGSRKKKMPSTP